MIGSKHFFVEPDHTAIEPFRFGILSLINQRVGEIITTNDRINMLAAENLLAQFQNLPRFVFRFCVLGLARECVDQPVATIQSVWMLRPESAGSRRDHVAKYF